MLPLSSVIKDAFDKFEHDFQTANLPEGKYIKPPPSTAKWYKVGQPCYEDKIQELNMDFAKICITPKPFGAPMGKVPLPVFKELEHQARQNIYTLNFTAAFAKTSFCNATLEKCQYSLKLTFKKVKSQIQKGANPEKAAKRGYEQACEYLDIWNQGWSRFNRSNRKVIDLLKFKCNSNRLTFLKCNSNRLQSNKKIYYFFLLLSITITNCCFCSIYLYLYTFHYNWISQMFFTIFIVVFYLIKVRQTLFHEKYMYYNNL